MMQFLTTLSVDEVKTLCGGGQTLRVIKFFLSMLDVVCFIIPMLLIVLIIVSFTKNVIAGNVDDMKKELMLVIKKLISCIAIFLVPTIVSALISLLGSIGIDYEKCFEIARTEDLSKYDIVNPNVETKKNNVDLSEKEKKVVPRKNEDETEDTPTETEPNKNEMIKTDKNIFIGDSRTVGMSQAVKSSSKDQWIAKTGEGYTWLVKNAISELDEKIKTGEKYNIFINLGVNDPGNINNYIKKYREITEKYSEHNVIIVSVNPINDKLAQSNYKIKDSQVDEFNEKLKSTSGLNYCDTNSKLKKDGFETGDGVHYKTKTYKKIYDEMLKCTN